LKINVKFTADDVNYDNFTDCRYQPSYTLCLKKVYPLMFDNNFCKCGPTFQILLPGDSKENSLCTGIHDNDFYLICNVLLHYLVKFENSKYRFLPRDAYA